MRRTTRRARVPVSGTVQVLSDPRGRAPVESPALCGTECLAGELGGVGRRRGGSAAYGVGSRATLWACWTRGRCACRRTGDSRCSPRRRKPNSQHCGGRCSAACPSGKRVGRTQRPSDYTWNPRSAHEVGHGSFSQPRPTRFKTPDPFCRARRSFGHSNVGYVAFRSAKVSLFR